MNIVIISKYQNIAQALTERGDIIDTPTTNVSVIASSDLLDLNAISNTTLFIDHPISLHLIENASAVREIKLSSSELSETTSVSDLLNNIVNVHGYLVTKVNSMLVESPKVHCNLNSNTFTVGENPTFSEQIKVLDAIRYLQYEDSDNLDMGDTERSLYALASKYLNLKASSDLHSKTPEEQGRVVLSRFTTILDSLEDDIELWLIARCYAIQVGAVSRMYTQHPWVDLLGNTYPANLSQKEAAKEAALASVL